MAAEASPKSPGPGGAGAGRGGRSAKSLAYLTSRVRLWTGQPFREPFLTREPAFRAADVALGLPKRHALLRAALDAFCDVDLRMERESDREDVRILLKQVERRLPAVREAAEHFEHLAAGPERAAAEVARFGRAVEEISWELRSVLEQSQEGVQSLETAVERILKQSYLEPERVTQMTLQRDPKLDAYLKVSSAAKKWRALTERMAAAWKRGREVAAGVAEAQGRPADLRRVHAEMAKSVEEVLYARELIEEVRRDATLFQEYARAIGAEPALLQGGDAAARLAPYLEGPLARARDRLRTLKVPDVRPVDPVARRRLLELSREFPWAEEYRKVLVYGEALRNRLAQRMEETAPGAERRRAG